MITGPCGAPSARNCGKPTAPKASGLNLHRLTLTLIRSPPQVRSVSNSQPRALARPFHKAPWTAQHASVEAGVSHLPTCCRRTTDLHFVPHTTDERDRRGSGSSLDSDSDDSRRHKRRHKSNKKGKKSKKAKHSKKAKKHSRRRRRSSDSSDSDGSASEADNERRVALPDTAAGEDQWLEVAAGAWSNTDPPRCFWPLQLE